MAGNKRKGPQVAAPSDHLSPARPIVALDHALFVDRSVSTITGPQNGLVEELCDYLTRTADFDASLLCAFAREFFAKVPKPLLEERTLEQLAAITWGSFRFLESAHDAEIDVEIVDPEDEGWSAPVTVIRAEVRDRPFIVDTIREYLSAENLPIQHYVYPVIGVVRNERGEIVQVTDPDSASARALVHCEIPRLPDPARREEVRREIARRLGDVVAATDDFKPMLEALRDTAAMVESYADLQPERRDEFEEIQRFLEWLSDGNFVFLGYRAYEIDESNGERVLKVELGSGLGILRREEDSAWALGIPVMDVSEELRRRVLEGPVLITSKTNAESTIHRRARMDYVGIKKLSSSGEVIGERRFLGLFTSKAYAEHADAIPILRHKLAGILRVSGAAPGSHDYKEINTIFNSMPKEDLFQASLEELEKEVRTVLDVLFSDEVHVSLRPDPLGRGVSAMVILPRGRFSGEVRQRIQEALAHRFAGTILNYHLAMSAGDQARLHFYVSASAERVANVTPDEVSKDIHEIIRSWDDRLLDELSRWVGVAEAHRLAALYGPAFPEEYRASTLPEVAVRDVEELERLRSGGGSVAIALREPRGRGRADAFRSVSDLKLFLVDELLVLSDFMPILDYAGLRVIEVAPHAISGPGLPDLMIYSFAVQDPEGNPVPASKSELLPEALLAVRRGDTPNDPFNALVLHAGLRWREVDLIRMYANYAFQSGLVPTRYAPARALVRHPELARLLVALFRARFDASGLISKGEETFERGVSALKAAIAGELETVSTLTDDRAMRRLVTLIDATVRTNYFRHGGADPTFRSGGVPYISIKVQPGEVEELKRSRLLYEIFVYSSRMEGIHLRGASVSRGGIRWSDRPDDFRTEVLGLVQTQIVKNSVIVPGGSKGGFITRRVLAEREEMLEEAAEQYRTLIRGLLDLTDNLVGGEVVPPEGVVRYDLDDPYLVVAADKGTARLSDIANAVAAEYHFWMGDAFASGGSHGYDHKKEGITARGAWECVRRHFWEMGKDIQTEPFTVAGIGDMSGDVFGNGMLLSRKIKLVLAFDHRQIFIDPDPDPEISYRERERLFKLGRSSWEDYDQSKLSVGAMIVPRASKEVALTAEAREVLGLEDGVDRLDGEALVRAALRSPVELLWNGGIGTYVKDKEETNAEVGDTSNDPVRIDAAELRCKVIGEGGNLGLTQGARISYALRGGRLNTDALDNSAGVDMSDHEVNLKILLAPMVRDGETTLDERNRLLERMTEEVVELVLKHNGSQSLAISLDESRSCEALADFTALISAFERDRLLDRSVEGIPSTEELQDRARDKAGLTRPTLCVLLAFAKLQGKARLLASSLPDDGTTEQYLIDYFPKEVVGAAGIERLRKHRLKREITATALVNDLVDLMGASFLQRVARDTGRPIEAVVGAWFIASRISGAAEIREDLERLEGYYPSEVIYRWLFGLARVLERTTRWTLANVEPNAPVSEVIQDLQRGLSQLRGEFARVVAGEDRALFEVRLEELKGVGLEHALAERLITLRFLPELLDILRIARECERDPLETAEAYYLISEHLGVTWIHRVLRATIRDEPWEKRLAQTLTADLQRAHRTIAAHVLQCRSDEEPLVECLAAFESSHVRETQLFREVLAELKTADQPPLAACAVAIRALSDASH
ncbi:MAG: NAD-glutamate dehydrogenase [Gemmatimonas sp.]|nr:NAD-glutamate dehydrogenase [Gemmatimonas sp.]